MKRSLKEKTIKIKIRVLKKRRAVRTVRKKPFKKQKKSGLLKVLPLKILSLFLIFGLNWVGISAIGGTLAYFNDTENSAQNSLQATTLGFSLNSPADFSPEITPTATSSRNINLTNDGLLGFNYGVSSTSTSGVLCDYLNLTAKLDGSDVYNGSIVGFNYNVGEFSTTTDEWQFTANLTSNDLALQNKTCNFDFVFDGIQIGGAGFSDQEIMSNTITSGIWMKVLINKVYYDVAADKGNEGDTSNPDEWIELYNPTDEDINVKNWTIIDNHATSTINANITIPALSFAVVSKNASTWAPGTGYWNLPDGVIKIILGEKIGDGLANTADMLILKDKNGNIVDQMNWGTPSSGWTNYNSNLWDPGLVPTGDGGMAARVPTGLDTDTVSDWQDLALPSLTLDYPVGGETWYVGHDYNIQWTATNPNGDQDNNKLSIDIYYSKNSGNTWAAIATSTQNDGSYNWHVPLFIEPGHYYVPSSHARIKVKATGPENFMVQAWASSNDFCPPIDYDALSPEDQQLVDQLINDGVINESEVIRGGVQDEQQALEITEENIEVEEQVQPEDSGLNSDLLTGVASEIVGAVQDFLGAGQDETATATTTEQTLPEETTIITEEQPAIEEQPVVIEEPITIEQPVPPPADSTPSADSGQTSSPQADPPAPTE